MVSGGRCDEVAWRLASSPSLSVVLRTSIESPRLRSMMFLADLLEVLLRRLEMQTLDRASRVLTFERVWLLVFFFLITLLFLSSFFALDKVFLED